MISRQAGAWKEKCSKAEIQPIYMPGWVPLERCILQAKRKVRKGYLNKTFTISIPWSETCLSHRYPSDESCWFQQWNSLFVESLAERILPPSFLMKPECVCGTHTGLFTPWRWQFGKLLALCIFKALSILISVGADQTNKHLSLQKDDWVEGLITRGGTLSAGCLC